MFKTSVIAAFILSATMGAAYAETKSEIPVNKDFSVASTTWNKGGDLVVVWQARNVDGALQICGAYSSTGKSVIQKFNLAVLKEAKVVADGKTLRKNLGFFKRLPNEGRNKLHLGETANCRLTNKPFPSGEISISTRSGTYKVSR